MTAQNTFTSILSTDAHELISLSVIEAIGRNSKAVAGATKHGGDVQASLANWFL